MKFKEVVDKLYFHNQSERTDLDDTRKTYLELDGYASSICHDESALNKLMEMAIDCVAAYEHQGFMYGFVAAITWMIESQVRQSLGMEEAGSNG